MSSYHFWFYQVFDGKREEHVKEEKKYAGAWLATYDQEYGGRDHYQADAEDRKKGQNRHDAPPENRGVEVEQGKDCPGNDALDKPADNVSLEDGVGNFFKFGKEKPVFIVREWRNADDEGNKFFLIHKQKEDDQDHHDEEGKKLQDVSCPGACLVIEKEATGLDKIRQGVRQLCRLKVQADFLEIGLDLGHYRAFVKEGLYLESDACVSSPLVKA